MREKQPVAIRTESLSRAPSKGLSRFAYKRFTLAHSG